MALRGSGNCPGALRFKDVAIWSDLPSLSFRQPAASPCWFLFRNVSATSPFSATPSVTALIQPQCILSSDSTHSVFPSARLLQGACWLSQLSRLQAPHEHQAESA